jgi:hypothetical protein
MRIGARRPRPVSRSLEPLIEPPDGSGEPSYVSDLWFGVWFLGVQDLMGGCPAIVCGGYRHVEFI